MSPRVVFLHGLESGPRGSKYGALATEFSDVISPDCRDLRDPEARFALAEQATKGMTNLILVGSSFGGLIAALLASRCPARVGGLLLLAPALHARWANAVAGITRLPNRTVIMHGVRDQVVPVEASRVFATSFQVDLLVVSDGHRLGAHRQKMTELVWALADSPSGSPDRFVCDPKQTPANPHRTWPGLTGPDRAWPGLTLSGG